MKTLIHKSIMFSLMALMLWSCKKDEVKVVAPDQAIGGSLKSSATSALILEKANNANNAITFDMTGANFGFSAATKNTLQIAIGGSSFAAPKNVTLNTKATSLSYNVLELNQLALALGLPFDNATELEARVKSEVSDKLSTVYSNVVKFSVQPYPLISRVYVPGDYQGWSPGTADSLTSAVSDGIYKGTIFFPNTAGASFKFKITPAKNWNTAYGDAGGGKLSTSGSDIQGPGAGSYLLTFNQNDLTLTFAQDSWAVIGNATPGGWDTDTDMKYNNTTGEWTVTVALSGTGFLKFRYNDSWSKNLGGKDGVLTAGGADIATPGAGTYKITLDAVANTYTIVKQ